MRLVALGCLLSAASMAAARSLPPRNYTTHDYYAVHLSPSVSPSELADFLGLAYDGELTSVHNHHVFKAPKHTNDVVDDAVQELKQKRRKREAGLEPHILDGVRFNQKQRLKPRHWKRGVPPETRQAGSPANSEAVARQREIATQLEIPDPTFEDQWHLFNVQTPGNDLNVTGVWLQGTTGKNVTACIVDDGLDMDSEDLRDNFFPQGSYDFNDHVDLPKPRLSDDRHGTRCAGEVAAVKNNVCGVGVAYDSNISGVRILSGDITDMEESLAINFELQKNDIYSCSWGPPDDGKTMQAPGVLIKQAMVTAIQEGRGGKGSIYVFAAGNGAAHDDNCNFDGYTNSIYSITVGAIDKNNEHPYYSEACSAQLVVTYSSGSGDAIHTTDVGENKCTAGHGGTSAAGPLAVGIFALVLQERPDLTWRDLQWLTVMTAVPFDQASDWTTTRMGKTFSHQFGYGKLDAYAIVEAAKTWNLVKPQAWFYSPWMHVKEAIPQGDQGLASVFEVTRQHLKEANLERLEHITLTMNVEHSRRGDLSVELISPDGFVSHLSTPRRDDEFPVGYLDWTFMSVAHWGEKGIGKWTVIVKDTVVNEHTGTFTDWKLRLWGECIEPSIQPLRPMPGIHDDDDHDATTTAPAHTTSISVPTDKPTITANPSDHPDRPVNQKPTSAASTASFETPTTATSTATPAASATELPENFLPSPFPTFGVSKRTQVWIYSSVALILAFCACLSTYLYLARRKRLRNSPRDDYEFEMLDDDDDDGAAADGARTGMLARAGARSKKSRRARRGGELYDAFAGESSDEDLLSDDDDHDDDAPAMEAYRDDKDGEGGST